MDTSKTNPLQTKKSPEIERQIRKSVEMLQERMEKSPLLRHLTRRRPKGKTFRMSG